MFISSPLGTHPSYATNLKKDREMKDLTELQERVNSIAYDIQNGVDAHYCENCDVHHTEPYDFCPDCGCETDEQMMGGMEYLEDTMDIQYTVSRDMKTMLGARLLVAFGGPNIWVDTMRGEVEGFWGSETATAKFYEDPMGVEMAASDLYWATRS